MTVHSAWRLPALGRLPVPGKLPALGRLRGRGLGACPGTVGDGLGDQRLDFTQTGADLAIGGVGQPGSRPRLGSFAGARALC
jgi:hypothetical protein